jgi:hypothetical protein
MQCTDFLFRHQDSEWKCVRTLRPAPSAPKIIVTLVPVDYAEGGESLQVDKSRRQWKKRTIWIHNIECQFIRQFNREKVTKETPFVCVCVGLAEFIALQSDLYSLFTCAGILYRTRDVALQYRICHRTTLGWLHTHTHITSHTNKERPIHTDYNVGAIETPSRIERERVWFAFDRNYLSWLYICVHIGDETANKATLTTRESFVRGWIHLSGQEQQQHSRRTSPVETYCSHGPVYNMSVGCV